MKGKRKSHLDFVQSGSSTVDDMICRCLDRFFPLPTPIYYLRDQRSLLTLLLLFGGLAYGCFFLGYSGLCLS